MEGLPNFFAQPYERAHLGDLTNPTHLRYRTPAAESSDHPNVQGKVCEEEKVWKGLPNFFASSCERAHLGDLTNPTHLRSGAGRESPDHPNVRRLVFFFFFHHRFDFGRCLERFQAEHAFYFFSQRSQPTDAATE